MKPPSTRAWNVGQRMLPPPSPGSCGAVPRSNLTAARAISTWNTLRNVRVYWNRRVLVALYGARSDAGRGRKFPRCQARTAASGVGAVMGERGVHSVPLFSAAANCHAESMRRFSCEHVANLRSRVFTYGLLLLASGASQVQAGEPIVRLQFENPTKERLANWPLFASVPLPAGAVPNGARLRVLTENGRPVASVAVPLARWADGSWRWVEVRGQAELPPAGSLSLALAPDSSPAGEGERLDVPRVTVSTHGDEVDIDTGQLRFRVRRGSKNWIEGLVFRGRKMDGAVLFGKARIDGKDAAAAAVENVTVLEANALRAVLQLEGRYAGSPLRYRVRLESFAGQPFVRVEHTFIVESEKPMVPLDQLLVRLELPDLGKPQLRFATEGSTEASGVQAPTALTQFDAEHFAVGNNNRPGKLRGWFDVHGNTLGVTLWVRWFWQQYPQSVRVERRAIQYALYDGEKGPTVAGTGAAKTHEFAFFFHGTTAVPSVDALENLPLVAGWPTSWLAEHRALPVATLAETADGREFLKRLAAAWERVQRTNAREEWDDRQSVSCPDTSKEDPHERRRRGFYGMWNWGDWNFPGYHDTTKGCDAWGNLEYDLAHVLALAYMATGESRYREPMLAAARHFMDVDTIHYHPRYPQWVGMNHPKNPLHWSFELGGVDLGHTWVEGLLWYFLLTGDSRGLSAARGIGDFLLRRVEAPLKGNPRQFGWPQIALVALYDLTGESRYLRGAKRYAELGMERHPPEPAKDWKLGILAEGLSYTHRQTADPRIRAWLEDYTRAVRALPEPSDARFWPAVAYVAVLTGDPDDAAQAKNVVMRLDFGSWAKPFTIVGRVGFAILTNLLERSTAKGPPPTMSAPTGSPAAETTSHAPRTP